MVAEALRERGHALISRSDLELFIAERALSEAHHELRKRVNAIEGQGRLTPTRAAHFLTRGVNLLDRHVSVVAEARYLPFERVARRRVPRDPDDWPTVAVALALDAAIWTQDYDFFGCGIAVWTTETLLAHLGG